MLKQHWFANIACPAGFSSFCVFSLFYFFSVKIRWGPGPSPRSATAPIKDRSNGVVRMYVTTFVTHKPEVRNDLLTFMQIVNNFALEPISKLCSFHNLFVNRNVCQISMRFEEANYAWNNWFTEVRLWKFGRNCCRWTGFIWSLLVTQVVTYIFALRLRHCFCCVFHSSF